MKSLPGDALPKGMEIPTPPSTTPPKPFTLDETNYAAEIRRVLAGLPFEARIENCEIRERRGASPEVLLHITIHRKEGEG